MDEDQELESEPPAQRRSCALLWVVLALCGGCLALSGALYAFRYELRVSLAAPSFDTTLELELVDPGFEVEGVAEDLRARFRRYGVLAGVATEGETILVGIASEDRHWADAILGGGAELRVLAEVPPEKLSQEAYASELSRIQAAQAAGTWAPEADTYATYPWHPQAHGAQSGPLLLETAGMLDPSDFDRFEVTPDATGRPALAFETTPTGAGRLRALSERALGRRLALVIDGEVRSAPIVRAAIGGRGIVDGGPKGWSREEIQALVIQLEAGPAPYRLARSTTRPRPR